MAESESSANSTSSSVAKCSVGSFMSFGSPSRFCTENLRRWIIMRLVVIPKAAWNGPKPNQGMRVAPLMTHGSQHEL